jgi:hypothetical protein
MVKWDKKTIVKYPTGKHPTATTGRWDNIPLEIGTVTKVQ